MRSSIPSVLLIALLLFAWRVHPDVSPTRTPADTSQHQPARLILDMADGNPGHPLTDSAFCDPKRLADWGYNGQIVNSQIEGIATFDAIAPGAVPATGSQRQWAIEHTRLLQDQVRRAHAAGVQCYAWMQVLVLPKAVAEKFKGEICDAKGRFDVHLPRTQELLKTQLNEIFDRLPELDGLVIRTGEIYLEALPYHSAGFGGKKGEKILGSTAIVNGPASHADILSVLRREVCDHRNKLVIYRTWDFGIGFHVSPSYYHAVTDTLPPSPNLIFSIKEQAGDFHQLTPINPTIGIGNHRQVIEVQAQREAYGKGSHPYYIGQGVIDGWEDLAWVQKPADPKGLADLLKNSNVAGVWTWSRGGGWDGPYIKNELWCELNAYVVAKYAQNPSRSEPEILDEFARKLGLKGDDLAKFRAMNLLSSKAVLRGQLTTLNANIDFWWARDDTLSSPNLYDFIRKGLVEKAIAEKHESVEMWKQIEQLSGQIAFNDPAIKEFVTTSATYGRIKYAIIEEGWTIKLLGQQGDIAGSYDRARMQAAITQYDELWKQWKELQATHPSCSSLPSDRARGDKPGMGAMIEHYRQVLQAATTQHADH